MAIQPTTRTVAAVPGIEQATNDDLAQFIRMCDRLRTNPDWVAAVIAFESGWSPWKKNPTSSASGLIQFMDETAAHLGTTTAKLRAMSISQQLPYVERHFAPNAGRMNSLASVYAAVFAPAYIGAADDAPVYSAPDSKYTANANVDKAGKGYITKADLARAAQGKLNAAGGRVITVNMTPAPSPVGPWLPLLLAAGLGYVLTSKYASTYGLTLPPFVRKALRGVTAQSA